MILLGGRQGSQSRTGDYTDLASKMIYFGTVQYRYTVSSLPLFYIYINKSLP